MKQHIALVAGVLVSAIAGPVLAQPLPPPYPGVVYPGVPPYEVVAIVRSTGLEPLTRPVRNGSAYALRALDPAGQEVRVVVDARNGRIARVVPVPGQRYPDARHVDPRYGEFPPPYGRAAGRAVPDGYGPGARVAALPPGAEGTPPSAHAPAIGSAPRPAAQSAPLPLPRPRPKSAAADSSAAKPDAVKPDAAKPEIAVPEAAPPHATAKDEKPAAVPAPIAPADELNE